jgi:hypothetical protein
MFFLPFPEKFMAGGIPEAGSNMQELYKKTAFL